jgi:hypothetical protein
MKFAKVETSFRDHPKALAAELLGLGLWLCALTYCRDHLTDGFVPEAAMMGFCGGKENKKAVKLLLSAGLIDRAPGGYFLSKYADKNDTKAQVEEAIEASRNRVRNHRMKRGGNGDVTRFTSDLCNANVPPSPSLLSSLSERGEPERGPDPPMVAVAVGPSRNDNVVPEASEPVPLSAEDRYAQAYAEGQRLGGGGAPYPVTTEPWERGAINRFTQTEGWGLGLRGQALIDAITAWSRDYRRAKDDKPQFEKGFAPTKATEWARSMSWKYRPPKPKPRPAPAPEPEERVNIQFALDSITAAIGGGSRRL